ncbi:MAG: DUF4931 domain-containing protein [Patescibacteria group bacterium]|nr:DUF4931 domain-containing protein [Patescibacteria group bacterium]
MAKFVPDILTKRWVIISSQRSTRPHQKTEKNKKKKKFVCPFCEGNEKLTPPEVFRLGGGAPDSKGWVVRVIPNKFPITDFHEVIIHSPRCGEELEDLSLPHLESIFIAYRARYNFYRKKGQVMIFANSRRHAGASLNHSHSQLVLLPFQINLDTLIREPINNLVLKNDHFLIYCPDFSQWPYEYWITPKKENTFFGDINDEEIKDLAAVFKYMLMRLKTVFKKHELSDIPFAYNFYIYPKENWYIRVIPRFVYRAGFELGTGLSVNIVDPYQAALDLKGEEERMEKVLAKLTKLKKI